MPKETEEEKQERLHFEEAVRLTLQLMDGLTRDSALEILGLSEREIDVVHMKWKYRLTFEQIAGNLSISPDRARTIHQKAIMKIYWRIPGVISDYGNKEQLEQENKELKRELETFKARFAALDPEMKEKALKSDIENKEIDDLDFSFRTYRLLYNAGIVTVGDLLKYDVPSLFAIKGFGRKCMVEVEAALWEHRLSLRKK